MNKEMSHRISKVVVSAIRDLQDSGLESVIESIKRTNCFVTQVRDESTKECYTIIDYSEPIDFYDEQHFVHHTLKLYELFSCYDVWYDC